MTLTEQQGKVLSFEQARVQSHHATICPPSVLFGERGGGGLIVQDLQI